MAIERLVGRFALIIFLCSWIQLGEAQAENEDLAEGVRLYEALDYEPAQALFEKALKHEGSSREEIAQAAFYLGVVRVALGDQEAGSLWFTVALSYDDTLTLPAGTSPKISDLFDELKAKLVFARPSSGSETPTNTNNVVIGPKTPAIDALVNERPRDSVREESSMFWTYAAGGSTVVAAGLALTFGVMAYGTASDIESSPHERAELEGLQGDLDRQGDLANTFLAATGVLAATTAVIYLVQGRKKKSLETPAISVSGTADGAMVGTWFSF
jgi:hypothetical protein